MATSFSRQRAAPSFLLVVLDSPAVDKNVAARLGLNDMASRRHAAREPDIPANSRTTANGDPAKNRRAGINHHIVFDDRVPGASLDQSAAVIHCKPLGSQCYSLIKAHVTANHRSLANDNTGPVVDEKTVADLRSGMNVDPRCGMRDLRNDAGKERRAQFIELMGEPMMGDRDNSRVAK